MWISILQYKIKDTLLDTFFLTYETHFHGFNFILLALLNIRSYRKDTIFQCACVDVISTFVIHLYFVLDWSETFRFKLSSLVALSKHWLRFLFFYFTQYFKSSNQQPDPDISYYLITELRFTDSHIVYGTNCCSIVKQNFYMSFPQFFTQAYNPK